MVMKGRRLSNNLCRIEGSVVTNSTEVSAAAQEEQLTYQLWHYHSDRGLTELSRSGLILILKKEGDDLCKP